jgi:hypothetical protein
MQHKDKLKGGLADKKQPKDFNAKSLAAGIKVEMEHTKDEALAREIAMDHLSEDPDYYDKLKDMEKTIIETTADGKQELVPGKEPLKKDPKKKTLRDRWEGLKKALNSAAAFMPMMEDESETEETNTSPESIDDENEDSVPQEAQDDFGNDVQAVPVSAQGAWASPQTQEEMSEEGDGSPASEEELIQALHDAGYSDAEIAHIVHGHDVPPPDVEQAKFDAAQLSAHIKAQTAIDESEQQRNHREREASLKHEHAKRMMDLEYERAKSDQGDGKNEAARKMAEADVEHKKVVSAAEAEKIKKMTEVEIEAAKIEAEHKKRMLELEYETAKKEKELEVKFKEEEHKMKLKLMEESNKHKAQIASEQHKIKLAEAKKPKPKLKKSEGEKNEDEIYEE